MSIHDEWLLALSEDQPTGLAEGRGGAADAAIGVVILFAFILTLWSSFVLGTVYLGTHAADLPFLGQFFGP
jgi:hypothetical protein